MTKLFKIGTLILVLLVTSCKSTKTVIASGELNSKISAKELIKEHQNTKANFKTLQSRVKIDYQEGEKSQGVTVTLRIERNKTIWISAPLGLVRAMATPDKVRFYDKINNQYFDGDYRLISELLGTEIDFSKLQNLLLGEAIYNLNNDKYNASINDEVYVLEPRKQQELFELFMLFHPNHFKVASLQISQPQEKRFLEVDYKEYQDVEKQKFPEIIKIIAVENTDEVNIDMELKSITLNQELRFPFRIPSGFEEIVIK
ncbi:DUF4292 domain-containing protein [Flavobacteriaceae bacterium AU392]|nr:DUF4292 domain-containing protein [Flavobacteriaceae bacterium]RKM84908.1 DUF4292 domain-containing protein [Flavobacteriaceae bacterium AU392]